MRARRPSPFMGLVLTLLVACGDSPAEPGQPPAGEVDASGGTISAAAGQVTLTFPAGAVSAETQITVAPAASPPANPDLIAGTAYDFGPDGTQFGQPVALSLGYDPAAVPAGTPEATLAIHKAEGGTWRRIEGSTVDRGSKKVTAPISSFSVYAIVSLGAPSQVTKEGDAQSAVAGTPVEIPPAVVVRNASGVPLSGLQVTFRVVEGGGSVTGATQVTDAAGRAALESWTLGSAAGPNALQASVEGLAAAERFTATALDPCDVAPAISIGQSVPGTLSSSDCITASGRHRDDFTLTLSAQTAFSASLSSNAFTPFLATFRGGGQIAGEADPGTATAPHILPAGTYTVSAFSLERGDSATAPPTGPYTLALSSMSSDPAGCNPFIYLASGVSVAGRIAPDDCEDVFDNQPEVVRWVDTYVVLVFAGQTLTATLSADFPYRFTLWENGSYLTGEFGRPAGSQTTLTATPTQTTFYLVNPISEGHQDQGNYTLSVSVSGGTSAARELPIGDGLALRRTDG